MCAAGFFFALVIEGTNKIKTTKTAYSNILVYSCNYCLGLKLVSKLLFNCLII